jgi:hypothetical protein
MGGLNALKPWGNADVGNAAFPDQPRPMLHRNNYLAVAAKQPAIFHLPLNFL